MSTLPSGRCASTPWWDGQPQQLAPAATASFLAAGSQQALAASAASFVPQHVLATVVEGVAGLAVEPQPQPVDDPAVMMGSVIFCSVMMISLSRRLSNQQA